MQGETVVHGRGDDQHVPPSSGVPVAWPLAKVAIGVRSAPAKQGWSKSTGPLSPATNAGIPPACAAGDPRWP